MKNTESKPYKNQIEWITITKAIACLAVIMIHVLSSWTDNLKILPYESKRVFLDSVLLQPLIRFAVPCFIMISGCLLLDPNRRLDISKLKKYIIRMLYILGIFGFGFCLIENIFNSGLSNIPKLLYESIFDLFEEKSWTHMWYIYMLIGLYIITPILRKFVESADKDTTKFILWVLFIFSSVIPLINDIFKIQITTFYLENMNYLFIYLMGYYLVHTDIINDKYIIIYGLIGVIGCALLGYLGINTRVNTFTIFESIFLIKLFSNGKIKLKNNKFISLISKYSLGIYIIHPFWINILNKGLGIYPDILPIMVGEIAIFIYTLVLSIISSIILYKLPIIKKIW